MTVKKEDFIKVPKKWGKEFWIVNCDEYCGKLLFINKNAESSYHFHTQKKETFFALSGVVALIMENKDYLLSPFTRPKTIMPGVPHGFRGVSEAVLLEISTHHEDSDVVRLSESRAGNTHETK